MTYKRIVLGVTGGVAAYKACELVRLCVKAGILVDVVMTQAGEHFVTAVTFQALSGRTVYTDLWDASIPNNMAHIELTRDAAGIVVVPATAGFMAKLVHGRADDLLSTLIVARQPTCPLMLAPAMNVEMWQNPATQRNAVQLRADGVTLLGPGRGDQACGETGDGRMLEPEEIFESIAALFAPKILAGKRVLITAGPTHEPIDPVRVITNHSSGKMGYAIADAARAAGAEVTLVSGPVALATPAQVTRVDVLSAREMFDAVKLRVGQCDIFIAVAAVADYHVVNGSAQKIKKDGSGKFTMTLDGTNASEFRLIDDTCTGIALAPGATCSVGVYALAATSGTKTANLRFTTATTGSGAATIEASANLAIFGFLAIAPPSNAFHSSGRDWRPRNILLRRDDRLWGLRLEDISL